MPENISPENAFWPRLTSELVSCAFRRERNNFDRDRFGHLKPLHSPLKSTILDLFALGRFYRHPYWFNGRPAIPGLDEVYALLEDGPSRDLFVKLLVYWMLGYEHVRLPLNTSDYWDLRRRIPDYVEKQGSPGIKGLDRYNVNGIRFHADIWAVLNTFLLEQYRCARVGIAVEPDDVVIDGGGCYGDSALYFASKARQVYCFECMPANIAVARENFALNPALAGKIELVEKALWSRSGDQLTFEEEGPASRHVSGGKGIVVSTQAIDDLVQSVGLERVDFIKMDIEGAEPDALLGAEATLREYRPRLAITIYHDVQHFASIPKWLAGLNLGYRFYLDHFTIHREETVLFAQVSH